MAKSSGPPSQQQPAGSRQSSLVRTIAIVLLALIVLVGLTILIIWLAIKPKKLVYSIEDGSIHKYNLSDKTNHLNASYHFILRAYNPNKKVSVYYDKVEVEVRYDDETLASGMINPFYQPRRNVTRFNLDLESRDVALSGPASRDWKQERSSGRVEVDVKLKARIRFKVGAWKSRHYHMKISCSPVMVHFSASSKAFQRVMCDVDI